MGPPYLLITDDGLETLRRTATFLDAVRGDLWRGVPEEDRPGPKHAATIARALRALRPTSPAERHIVARLMLDRLRAADH